MAIDRIPAAWLLLVLGFVGGCNSQRLPRPEVHNEEPSGATTDDAPPLVSSIAMNDPKVAHQLISGFYMIEGNAWRWTARSFSAELLTPPGAGLRGAGVSLRFAVPEALVKSGPVTLTASVEGRELKADVFRSADENTFSAEVPADLLARQWVKVDFALDRSIPPSPAGDRRELGVIASSLRITTLGITTK